MIDPDKWLSMSCCERLCNSFSYEKRWYEPWLTRSCKYIDVFKSNSSIFQYFRDEIKYMVSMETSGYLRYDPECFNML